MLSRERKKIRLTFSATSDYLAHINSGSVDNFLQETVSEIIVVTDENDSSSLRFFDEDDGTSFHDMGLCKEGQDTCYFPSEYQSPLSIIVFSQDHNPCEAGSPGCGLLTPSYHKSLTIKLDMVNTVYEPGIATEPDELMFFAKPTEASCDGSRYEDFSTQNAVLETTLLASDYAVSNYLQGGTPFKFNICKDDYVERAEIAYFELSATLSQWIVGSDNKRIIGFKAFGGIEMIDDSDDPVHMTIESSGDKIDRNDDCDGVSPCYVDANMRVVIDHPIDYALAFEYEIYRDYSSGTPQVAEFVSLDLGLPTQPPNNRQRVTIPKSSDDDTSCVVETPLKIYDDKYVEGYEVAVFDLAMTEETSLDWYCYHPEWHLSIENPTVSTLPTDFTSNIIYGDESLLGAKFSVVIHDEDVSLIEIQTEASVFESSSINSEPDTTEVQIMVTMSKVVGHDVTVRWALLDPSDPTGENFVFAQSGTDINVYDYKSDLQGVENFGQGSITFPAHCGDDIDHVDHCGTQTKLISVIINNDRVHEVNMEYFQVKLISIDDPELPSHWGETNTVELGNDSCLITVTEINPDADPTNDVPSVSFSSDDLFFDINEGEELLIELTMSNQSDYPVKVDWHLELGGPTEQILQGVSADFASISGTVTFEIGATATEISINPVNDNLVEGSQRVRLVLSTGDHIADMIAASFVGYELAPSTASGVFINVGDMDKATVSVTTSKDFNEELGGTVSYGLKLDTPSEHDISIYLSVRDDDQFLFDTSYSTDIKFLATETEGTTGDLLVKNDDLQGVDHIFHVGTLISWTGTGTICTGNANCFVFMGENLQSKMIDNEMVTFKFASDGNCVNNAVGCGLSQVASEVTCTGVNLHLSHEVTTNVQFSLVNGDVSDEAISQMPGNHTTYTQYPGASNCKASFVATTSQPVQSAAITCSQDPGADLIHRLQLYTIDYSVAPVTAITSVLTPNTGETTSVVVLGNGGASNVEITLDGDSVLDEANPDMKVAVKLMSCGTPAVATPADQIVTIRLAITCPEHVDNLGENLTCIETYQDVVMTNSAGNFIGEKIVTLNVLRDDDNWVESDQAVTVSFGGWVVEGSVSNEDFHPYYVDALGHADTSVDFGLVDDDKSVITITLGVDNFVQRSATEIAGVISLSNPVVQEFTIAFTCADGHGCPDEITVPAGTVSEFSFTVDRLNIEIAATEEDASESRTWTANIQDTAPSIFFTYNFETEFDFNWTLLNPTSSPTTVNPTIQPRTCEGLCGLPTPEHWGVFCDEMCHYFDDCADDFVEVCESCQGHCGVQAANSGSLCNCDNECHGFKDCCEDIDDFCVALYPTESCKTGCDNAMNNRGKRTCRCDLMALTVGDACNDYEDYCTTCQNTCGESYSSQRTCQCDENCEMHDDCCTDHLSCLGSCSGRCLEQYNNVNACHCDDGCEEAGDCCADFDSDCVA